MVDSGDQVDLAEVLFSAQRPHQVGSTATTFMVRGETTPNPVAWEVNGSEVVVPEHGSRGVVQANGDIDWGNGTKAVLLPPEA